MPQVYDSFITLDEDIRLVWPSRLSLLNIVFLINRYMPVLVFGGCVYVFTSLTGSETNHKQAIYAVDGAVGLIYCISEFILYVRAYAVWGCTRRMLFFARDCSRDRMRNYGIFYRRFHAFWNSHRWLRFGLDNRLPGEDHMGSFSRLNNL